MATPRQVRRAAFQVLFQIDINGIEALDSVRTGLEDIPNLTPAQRDHAVELAKAAYENREKADETFTQLAPNWPPHRLAPVDRAILRLAHYEMTSGTTPPKVTVNEAVELAKTFSTDKSPAFINGLLDKILKQILRNAQQQTQSPQSSQTEPTTRENIN